MKRDRVRFKFIQRMSQILEEKYRPERIVLFGSFAKGRITRDSDVDLLIVKRTSLPFYQRLVEVRRLVSSARRGIPFDPIVVTPEELSCRIKVGDRFLEDILQSGQVLYAKS